MGSHTPWQDPPLQEAVFEVRFPPVEDYAIFVGGMAEVNRDRFPIQQSLPANQLPLQIAVGGAVRHRFISEDKGLLFQTGIDVLSINTIAYPGFDVFIEQIQEILEKAQKYADIKSVERLGLRYINLFENIHDPFSILRMASPIEPFDLEKTAKIKTSVVTQEATDLLLATSIDFPVSASNLILALDAFQQNFQPETSWDLNSIFKWINQAHEVVWSNFERLVKDEEKHRRQ